MSLQSDGEDGEVEGEEGSEVDKSYEVQFAMSPECPEQEEGEEPTTAAEGMIIIIFIP